MNIWLMNHYASMQYRDKSGRHYWFAKELMARGYSPTIFCASAYHDSHDCVDLGAKKHFEVIDEDSAVPFVFVKTRLSTGNGIERVLNMSDFYFNLFGAAKAYAKAHGKPDVIIASSVHPLTMIAGIKIAKRLNVPCICEIRDLWPEALFVFGRAREKSLLGKILIKGEHWIYKKADALIFTKEGDTDYLKERGWTSEQGGDIPLKKCHYINNGIDIANFAERITQYPLDDADLLDTSRFNVTYAGIIRPVNNVGMILDAAKLLKDHADIQFLIYGNGNELDALKKRVADENIENVKLKGYVHRRYIPFVLSRSKVNLLNYSQSQYNWSRGNSSNKLFEYMASGKPVISTVHMGYSIIAKYDCGLELVECNARALADAVLKIHTLDDAEYRRLGGNAARGAKDFDFTALTTRLENVINEVRR